MDIDLNGKIAIVTGVGSPAGMGYAMTIALLRAGARVAMLSHSEEGVKETAAQAQDLFGARSVVPLVADVADLASLERAVERTLSDLGGLDILVNNAGTNPRAAGFELRSRCFWDLPPAAWDRVVAVNMSGPFYMARTVASHFLAQDFGRIIGVTTSVDTMFGARRVPYGPSKAGHEALMASMAEELEGSGVTANILVPGGPTDTGFFASRSPAERAALIQPAVMQAPVVWLASDASEGCNGRRIIACHWDERRTIEDNLSRASAPAAWPQLGKQAVPARTLDAWH